MNTLSIRHCVRADADEQLYRIDLLVDGVPLTSERHLCTDLQALLQSIREPGEHYLLTCTCSVAECGGLRSGIQVAHEDGFVFWRFTEPEPERAYAFDAAAYRSTVESASAAAREIVRHDPPSPKGTLVVVPHGQDEFLADHDSRLSSARIA